MSPKTRRSARSPWSFPPSKQPDLSPTIERRQDVNLLYWRNQGRAYALVGQADIGYLWGIANDIAWQLRAI